MYIKNGKGTARIIAGLYFFFIPRISNEVEVRAVDCDPATVACASAVSLIKETAVKASCLGTVDHTPQFRL